MKTENNVIFICIFLIIAICAMALIPHLTYLDPKDDVNFFFAKGAEENSPQAIENMFYASFDNDFTSDLEKDAFIIEHLPKIPSVSRFDTLAANNKTSVIIYAQGDKVSGTIARAVERNLSQNGCNVLVWDISDMDLASADITVRQQAADLLSELILRANDADVNFVIGLDIFNLSAHPFSRIINSYYNNSYILDGVTGIDLSLCLESGLLEYFGAHEYAIESATGQNLPIHIKNLLFEDEPFSALKNTMTPACEIVIAEGGEITKNEADLIVKGICSALLDLRQKTDS